MHIPPIYSDNIMKKQQEVEDEIIYDFERRREEPAGKLNIAI